MVERESFHTHSMDDELGTVYSPDLLTKKPILLSPFMLSRVSGAECEFSRADQFISLSPNKEAVREFLVNLESLAAAVIDGDSIDLIDLLASNIAGDSARGDRTVDPGGMPRAVKYKNLIEEHSDPEIARSVLFNRSFMFSLHAQLSYGNPDEFQVSYRGSGADCPDKVHPRLPQRRTIPPYLIDRYMNDLCDFCNREYYSPQIQACLPHFQIEYIKPFKSHIEALGRHLSYMVYARRGFCRSAIIPIALSSLARINMPVDSYKVDHRLPSQQPLALWILHGAKALEITAAFVCDVEKNLTEIERNWRCRVPSVRNGDICNLLLHDMLANPVINSTYVMRKSGKTAPAVGDAFAKLLDAGVIRPLNSKRRYRLFCAEDVIKYYYRLFDAVIPPSWVPGKRLFYD
ncbi:hypothetical protein [Raoultibacter massiliensis]|uniref:hypothetical protein n=1 Tax=Raoultibacter massiliensis TaxID=1852371 RepID=UPI003A913BF6